MTDKEIIKALKHCTNKEAKYCTGCPLSAEMNCVNLLAIEALDLINCQKAKIEELKTQRSVLVVMNNGKRKLLKAAKAEAVKEFAEKVKGLFNPDIAYDISREIDNLVKEMAGEKE